MIGQTRLGKAIARRGVVKGRQYVLRTLRLAQYGYSFFFWGSILLGMLWGYLSPESYKPSLIIFAGAAVCDVLSTIFGGRVTFGVATYKIARSVVRRVHRNVGGNPSNTGSPNLLNVWYWTQFIGMWLTATHYAIAILRPWRVGLTMQLIVALFMILHIVRTQRGVGEFWRRVYACGAVTVLAATVLSIVMPGTVERITGSLFFWDSVNGGIGSQTRQAGSDTRSYLENLNKEIRDLELERQNVVLKTPATSGKPAATWNATKADRYKELVKERNTQASNLPTVSSEGLTDSIPNDPVLLLIIATVLGVGGFVVIKILSH